MLTRAQLRAIQAHNDYPSVSILAPTHRTAPANKQDPIRVKNLVAKAVDRLQKEFSKREVASVVKNLESQVRKLKWAHLEDGLALFASKDQAHTFLLPFKVKPRLAIDASFATRDLVFTLNRTPLYRVLVLSEKPTRLFEGSANQLTEVKTGAFPMVHAGPGGESRLPGGFGINVSAKRDEAHRQFFRKVDAELARLQAESPTKIVVVGVDRYLAFFQEVTQHGDAIVAMITGNHDKTAASVLGKLVWPVFQAAATRQRTQALVRLDEAVSVNRHASGINQVWRAIFDNRCATLLVERDFAYPANVSPQGDELKPFTGKGAAALDDAVDEAIERTLAQGGEVLFYEPGTLEVHQRIAAVLRY